MRERDSGYSSSQMTVGFILTESSVLKIGIHTEDIKLFDGRVQFGHSKIVE